MGLQVENSRQNKGGPTRDVLTPGMMITSSGMLQAAFIFLRVQYILIFLT
jgi:hypothetical protein